MSGRIKICGLTRVEDINAANDARPDYIGFVFAPQSMRFVTPEQAALLRFHLHPAIAAVGVFVNADAAEILRCVHAGSIDVIQLHGNETETFVRSLKAKTDVPIIKAVRVDGVNDIRKWNDSAANYLLLDNGTGGTGQRFDWSLTKACRKPYFLAGGVNLENLESALDIGAFCIDISSGAETDRRKDREKMIKLTAAVKKRG